MNILNSSLNSTPVGESCCEGEGVPLALHHAHSQVPALSVALVALYDNASRYKEKNKSIVFN